MNQNKEYIFRIFDLFFGTILLLVLFPIILICIVSIKLAEPTEPVFFKQKRVGKNGRYFWMYKLRTMHSNSEKKLEELTSENEMSGPLFKIRNDPRVTSVGKILRKYSLDELPQLVNVLKGEMGIVGPRPPLIAEYNAYTTIEKQRLTINPGCTGPWQVSGRNNVDFHEMVQLDLKYICERSIALNVVIILKTIRRMTVDADGC
ncbi:sugar transferase [Enterococcus rivorum]|uniref:Multidrug MFS transporter n=1 Tax=Enterococcus rivorum TaxID=762845 RepID=A0A1E5KSF0_9ENTE|nr:sugar transferase [Enterococcus rivorum]MBP2097445.1 lipopolysaccharide/colanic/teichoic acid biosynthesis glycosyltransferase [Enterococcus rivorum]OEH80786.1 multidrug MFS transporter [Enterococcus rivorum]